MKRFFKFKGENTEEHKRKPPKRIHVLPRKKDWVVKKQGGEKAIRIYSVKRDAVKLSENYRSKGFDVIIHGKNGAVKEWKYAKK